MILSDREIRAALTRESLRITPDPQADASLWSSTAVDLRLDQQLAFWDFGNAEVHFRPADPEYDYHALVDRYSRSLVIPEEGLLVKPGEFYLGWTVERIQLPYRSRLAARVEGKSGLARLGLGIHVTAPTIHAGFGYNPDQPDYPGSPIQLEIWNIGPINIILNAGMEIFQMIFETVDGTPEKGYEGRFSIQGPQMPGVPF